MNEFEAEYQQLISWTKAFQATVESSLPRIRAVFDGTSKLPENCPSRASMVELIFRDVRERLDDVVACVESVEKSIWKAGS